MLLDLMGYALLLVPFAFFWANCPCCGGSSTSCTDFCSDGGQETIDVLIAGVGAGSISACADCSVMNATFTLTTIGPCQWQLILAGCGLTLNLTITDLGGGMARVKLAIDDFFLGSLAVFQEDVAYPFDCTVELELPADTIDGTLQICDFTGATVTMNP